MSRSQWRRPVVSHYDSNTTNIETSSDVAGVPARTTTIHVKQKPSVPTSYIGSKMYHGILRLQLVFCPLVQTSWLRSDVCMHASDFLVIVCIFTSNFGYQDIRNTEEFILCTPAWLMRSSSRINFLREGGINRQPPRRSKPPGCTTN